MNKHILIDGNNLFHRVFHAFSLDVDDKKYQSDSGYLTGMIYGSLSFLSNWFKNLGHFNSVHFFNDGIPTRRRNLDPSYKVCDNSKPSFNKLPSQSITLKDGFEAKNQIDIIFHVLQLIGVSVYFYPNEEADDLIASFVKKHEGDVNIIISSDKDFFQLLTNPRVVVCRPGSGKLDFIDADKSESHWVSFNQGKHPPIPPDSVRLFKSLCGDSSDGINGVPRLRKKVAASAIKDSKNDLDLMIKSDWPGFSENERKNASDLIDRIKLNWELVGLIDNIELVPVSSPIPDSSMAEKILSDLDVVVDLSPIIPKKQRIITDVISAKLIEID